MDQNNGQNSNRVKCDVGHDNLIYLSRFNNSDINKLLNALVEKNNTAAVSEECSQAEVLADDAQNNHPGYFSKKRTMSDEPATPRANAGSRTPLYKRVRPSPLSLSGFEISNHADKNVNLSERSVQSFQEYHINNPPYKEVAENMNVPNNVSVSHFVSSANIQQDMLFEDDIHEWFTSEFQKINSGGATSTDADFFSDDVAFLKDNIFDELISPLVSNRRTPKQQQNLFDYGPPLSPVFFSSTRLISSSVLDRDTDLGMRATAHPLLDHNISQENGQIYQSKNISSESSVCLNQDTISMRGNIDGEDVFTSQNINNNSESVSEEQLFPPIMTLPSLSMIPGLPPRPDISIELHELPDLKSLLNSKRIEAQSNTVQRPTPLNLDRHQHQDAGSVEVIKKSPGIGIVEVLAENSNCYRYPLSSTDDETDIDLRYKIVKNKNSRRHSTKTTQHTSLKLLTAQVMELFQLNIILNFDQNLDWSKVEQTTRDIMKMKSFAGLTPLFQSLNGSIPSLGNTAVGYNDPSIEPKNALYSTELYRLSQGLICVEVIGRLLGNCNQRRRIIEIIQMLEVLRMIHINGNPIKQARKYFYLNSNPIYSFINTIGELQDKELETYKHIKDIEVTSSADNYRVDIMIQPNDDTTSCYREVIKLFLIANNTLTISDMIDTLSSRGIKMSKGQERRIYNAVSILSGMGIIKEVRKEIYSLKTESYDLSNFKGKKAYKWDCFDLKLIRSLFESKRLEAEVIV